MDHYSTLGVSKDATPDDIKKAYRKLASKHHPDKGGNTSTFQKIQTAYDVLSDPNKRQEFDNPHQHHGGFPGGFNFGGGNPFDSMFGDLFKQHHQRHQHQQPMYRTTLVVSLEQVYTGGEQPLQLQTQTGVHAAKITIPRGIQDGAQVKIDNIINGAILIVEFRIHPHLKFNRNGQDLVSNHQVSVLDLIVGGSFEFTTISGKTLSVTIPPKTQPNAQMKIAGEGLPIPGASVYGDQIVLLKPFIPSIIDESIISSILNTRTK